MPSSSDRDSLTDSQSISFTSQQSKSQLYSSLPIKTGPHSFRTLELQASEDRNGPLVGHLRAASLNQGDVSFYHALSYVWGCYASPVDTIAVSGVEFGITKNCHDALRRLRELQGNARVWVDAICINQADEEERNHQIPLMRDIYLWADIVYIWLGESSPAFKETMVLFRLAAKANILPVRRRESKRRPRYTRLKVFLRLLAPSIAIRTCIGAWNHHRISQRFNAEHFEAFLNQEWFLRAWTLQEALLADDPVMLYDDDLLSWDALVNSVHVIRGLIATEQRERRSWSPGRDYVCYGDESSRSKEPDFKFRTQSPFLTTFERLDSLLHVWASIERPLLQKDDRRDLTPTTMQSFMQYQKDSVTRPLFQILPSHWWVIYLVVSVWSSTYVLAQAIYFVAFGTGSMSDFLSEMSPSSDNALYQVALFLMTLFIGSITLEQVHFGRKFIYDHDATDSTAECIIQAVRERKATDSKDKSYSLHGILQKLGVPLSKSDYGKSQGEIYHELLMDLISWRPEMLVLLLDAGDTKVSSASDTFVGPSWVPNWQHLIPDPTISSDHFLMSHLREHRVSQPIGSSGSISSDTTFKLAPYVRISQDKQVLFVHGQLKGCVKLCTARFDRIPPALTDGSDLDTAAPYITSPLADLITWFNTLQLEDTPRSIKPRGLVGFGAILDNDPSPENATRLEEWKHKELTPSESAAFETCFLLKRQTLIPEKDETAQDLLEIVRKFDKQTSDYPQSIAFTDRIQRLARDLWKEDQLRRSFVQVINELADNDRRLFITSDGVGCGTGSISAEDRIVVVSGLPAPLILRTIDATTQNWFDSQYTTISSAFVPGLMNGLGWVSDQTREIGLV